MYRTPGKPIDSLKSSNPIPLGETVCWITVHTPMKTDLLTRTEQSHSFTQIEQSNSSAAIFVGSFWRFTHQENWFTRSDRAVPLSYSDRAIPFRASAVILWLTFWRFTHQENWFTHSDRAVPLSYSDRAIPFYSSRFRRIKWRFTQMENWFYSNRAIPF